MKSRSGRTRKSFIVLMIMMAVAFTTAPVHAMSNMESEGIDPGQNGYGSVTVNRAPDTDWPVNGTVFHLYQVADLKDDMTFSDTDEFKGSKVTLPKATETPDSSWEDTTDQLVTEVNQNDLKPLKTETWTNGSATFRNLHFGLYLLVSDETTVNGKKYASQGNLISVPNRDDVNDEWKYNIPVEVKYSYETLPASPTPSVTSTPVPTVTPKPVTTVTPTPSSKELKKNPDTGDHFNVWIYTGMMITMGIIIGTVVYIRSEGRKD